MTLSILVNGVLSDERFPPHSAKDIVEQLRKFQSYLEMNKDHIVKTGFPQYDLKHTPFFDYLEMTFLYFVKLPIEVNKSENVNGETEFDFFWGRESNDTLNLCEYEEADLIDGLSSRESERLEGSREELFDLKVNIIKGIIKQIESGSYDSLWKHCLEIFKENLSAEDAQFYLQMDVEYSGRDFLSGNTKPSDEVPLNPGGLTEILEFIGYCQIVLSFCTTPEVESLLTCIKTDPSGLRYLEFDSYITLYENSPDNLIDEVMRLLISLESDPVEFW